MLLKQADSLDEKLAALERQLAQAGATEKPRLEQTLRNMKAGARGEREAAYYIDFDYGSWENGVVIHDLRLEIGGRVAQIDHLLINRLLECYVLESKHFHAGVKITEDGEFLRWNNYNKSYEGMASPLLQNERHIAVLKDAFASINLPTRLGIRLMPTFLSYVLISPNARIDRPKNFDTSKVVKADALKAAINEKADSAGFWEVSKHVAKFISVETLYDIGRQLVALHSPAPTPRSPEHVAPKAAELVVERKAVVPQSNANGLQCAQCGQPCQSIQYGKFGYYFKCSCGKNNAVKGQCDQPGHKPRVRKDGRNFFRECANCQSSALLFTNPE